MKNFPKHLPSSLPSALTLDSHPSIYYSRAYGEWGFSIGYAATIENVAEFEVEATRSEYIVDLTLPSVGNCATPGNGDSPVPQLCGVDSAVLIP